MVLSGRQRRHAPHFPITWIVRATGYPPRPNGVACGVRQYPLVLGEVNEQLFGQYARWYGNSSVQHSQSHPVGMLKPNDFGLFDMYGNVSEWCQNLPDSRGKDVSSQPDKNEKPTRYRRTRCSRRNFPVPFQPLALIRDLALIQAFLLSPWVLTCPANAAKIP